MNYLRSLFLNFLIVFFINRMAPGVEIGVYEQVTNIGADILFSVIVGFLNASVFPFLFILELKPNKLKIGILTFLISFSSFIAIAFIPFGVRVVNVWGVIVGGLVVWGMAFFTNYLEFVRDKDLKL